MANGCLGATPRTFQLVSVDFLYEKVTEAVDGLRGAGVDQVGLLTEKIKDPRAAAQARGKVVFLHEVREGPASQSYGLAVAQLAGVPAEVVRRARALLARLEERAAGNQPQLDLFAAGEGALAATPAEPAAESRPDELRERLAAVEVDALSPREALALLYELKGLAGR